jgi:hypothetical protein
MWRLERLEKGCQEEMEAGFWLPNGLSLPIVFKAGVHWRHRWLNCDKSQREMVREEQLPISFHIVGG